MTDKADDKARTMSEAERRNARRAAALRENLRRRKARERSAGESLKSETKDE